MCLYTFRIYPNEEVVFEDDFNEDDCRSPLVDDYATVQIPAMYVNALMEGAVLSRGEIQEIGLETDQYLCLMEYLAPREYL